MRLIHHLWQFPPPIAELLPQNGRKPRRAHEAAENPQRAEKEAAGTVHGAGGRRGSRFGQGVLWERVDGTGGGIRPLYKSRGCAGKMRHGAETAQRGKSGVLYGAGRERSEAPCGA